MAKQYDTVVKLKFLHDKDAEKYIAMQEKLLKSSTEPQPIVFRSKKDTHHDVFFEESEYAGEKEKFDCFVGLPSDDDKKPFMTVKMKIADVARYKHFDNGDYPDACSYFMYGDKKSVFLFHIPTKSPDFFQVITNGYRVNCYRQMLLQPEPYCNLQLRFFLEFTTYKNDSHLKL